MAQNKCPLCGGRIRNGSCSDCGYFLPDEASVAAPYNYDPSDYNLDEKRYGAAPVKEADAALMPEIKVVDEKEMPPAPAKLPNQNAQYNNTNNQRNGNYANPAPAVNINKQYNQNGQYNQYNQQTPQGGNPYAGFNPTGQQSPAQPQNNQYNPQEQYNQYNQPSPQNGNPYAGFNPTNNKNVPGRFGGGAKKGNLAANIIIGTIFTFIYPFFGLIYSIKLFTRYNQTKDQEDRTAAIIIAILTVISFIIRFR